MKYGTLLSLLASFSASAGTISLKPGSEAVINAGEVTKVACEKTSPEDFREIVIPEGKLAYNVTNDCEKIQAKYMVDNAQSWTFNGFLDCAGVRYVIGSDSGAHVPYNMWMFKQSDVILH